MENINYALYQILGAILFLMALVLLYWMNGQLNQGIDYRIEHIHEQKALDA